MVPEERHHAGSDVLVHVHTARLPMQNETTSIYFFFVFKEWEAGELIHWLGALVALPKKEGFLPVIHTAAHSHLKPQVQEI